MRIALIAPLFETVPPRKYGGTERVVHWIAEELHRLGHEVTLYAAAGSQTSAKLVKCSPASFRELDIRDFTDESENHYTAQLQLALSGIEGHDHDVVHVHHGTYPYQLAVLEENLKTRNVPVMWTDHNAIHTENKPAMFDNMSKVGVGLTGLSDSHRNTVPEANWLETIHHGLPATMLTPSNETEPTYLAFLGRISPEKGIKTAVRISEAGGYELKVAAKVDKLNQEFYDEEVAPLFAESNVDFIGEICEKQKGPFLSNAIALIFPISWKEPFGLVMIEAMACGCPVIAYRMGSVEEIIEDGITGFVVDTEEEAIAALPKLKTLSRERVRQRFEERFTATIMAQKYVEVYERVIKQAELMNEAKEHARHISLQHVEEPKAVADANAAAARERERAEIFAAFKRAAPVAAPVSTPFQDSLAPPSLLARPAMSRQVSANM